MAAQTRPAKDLTIGTVVGWIVVGSLMFWPRLFIVGFLIFGTSIWEHAYDNWLVLIAGFFVLPWTTVAYALMWGTQAGAVTGWEWAVVGLGLLLDVYTWACARA